MHIYQRFYKVIYAILLVHNFSTLLCSHIELVRDEDHSVCATQEALSDSAILGNIYNFLSPVDKNNTQLSPDQKSFKHTSVAFRQAAFNAFCLKYVEPLVNASYEPSAISQLSKKGFIINTEGGPGYNFFTIRYCDNIFRNQCFYQKKILYVSSNIFFNYENSKNYLNEEVAAIIFNPEDKKTAKDEINFFYKEMLNHNVTSSQLFSLNSKNLLTGINNKTCINDFIEEVPSSQDSPHEGSLYMGPIDLHGDTLAHRAAQETHAPRELLRDFFVRCRASLIDNNDFFNFMTKRNQYGHTPLQVAVLNNNLFFVSLLISYLPSERLIDLNQEDTFNAVLLALKHKNYFLVNTLLKKSTDIDCQDRFGNTLLHRCKTTQDFDFLVSKKIDMTIANCKGNTYLHSLIENIICAPYIDDADLPLMNDYLALLKKVLNHLDFNGINIINNNGHTLLHLAFKGLYKARRETSRFVWDAINMILNHPNIDVNVVDKEGKSCLYEALQSTSRHRGSNENRSLFIPLLSALLEKTKAPLVSESILRYCNNKNHHKGYVLSLLYDECLDRGIKTPRGNVPLCKYFIANQIAGWQCLNPAKKKILKDAAIIFSGMALYASYQSLDEDVRLLASAIGIKLLLNMALYTNTYLSYHSFPHLKLTKEKRVLLWLILTMLSSHLFIRYFNPDDGHYLYVLVNFCGLMMVDQLILQF